MKMLKARFHESWWAQPSFRTKSGHIFKTFASPKFCLKSVFTKGDLARAGVIQRSYRGNF